jgi:hypothetical protein
VHEVLFPLSGVEPEHHVPAAQRAVALPAALTTEGPDEDVSRNTAISVEGRHSPGEDRYVEILLDAARMRHQW